MNAYQIAALVLSLASIVMNLLLYRSSANKATSDKVAEKVDRLENKVASIESQLVNMPTHKDLGALYERLNSTNKELAELSGELTQVNANLRLLLQDRMNKS